MEHYGTLQEHYALFANRCTKIKQANHAITVSLFEKNEHCSPQTTTTNEHSFLNYKEHSIIYEHLIWCGREHLILRSPLLLELVSKCSQRTTAWRVWPLGRVAAGCKLTAHRGTTLLLELASNVVGGLQSEKFWAKKSPAEAGLKGYAVT